MRAIDVIRAKRDGEEIGGEDIRRFVLGYAQGDIPDYQMSAWLMAVCLRGMTMRETGDLTAAMAESGRCVDLSAFGSLTADKHSTGGVGDKTSLVALPLAAALGVKVAKMSGRGLAHTGGTVDKLESIRGFRTELSIQEFLARVERPGIVIAGQSGDLAPADKKIYALRDVTATVESLPLIAASVMSKKLAAGARNIVLDVKAGSGAFMKTVEEAVELAKAMVAIGESQGRRVAALVTDMQEPLGRAVGNALEIAEAVRTLKGQGPADLTEVCVLLAAEMVCLVHGVSLPEARSAVRGALVDGSGLSVFRSMVMAQGGEWDATQNTPVLPPPAPLVLPVPAPASGFVASIDALRIGRAALFLGAGREKKEDAVDPRVGLELCAGRGDPCTQGQPILRIHAADSVRAQAAASEALAGIMISPEPGPARRLFRARVNVGSVGWMDNQPMGDANYSSDV